MPTSKVAADVPLVLPNVMVPVPKAFAAADEPKTVPASMVNPPVKVLAPPKVNCDVVLFSTTPVTLVPITELIVVAPVPAPTLVTVPVLLMLPVANVTVPLVPFSLIVKLLVPVTPPLKVVDIAVPLLPMVKVSPLASVFKTMALV